MQTFMRMLAYLLLGALVAGVAAGDPALAQSRGDQGRAFQARRDGRILPLDEIQRRVIPQMHGWQYIGIDFDSGSGIYTLKFLRNGTVMWVDVDGRSGGIVGRSGN
jgi:hypothetical protein